MECAVEMQMARTNRLRVRILKLPIFEGTIGENNRKTGGQVGEENG
jgi:hypothetical protein